jgi:hypothetical protein
MFDPEYAYAVQILRYNIHGHFCRAQSLVLKYTPFQVRPPRVKNAKKWQNLRF